MYDVEVKSWSVEDGSQNEEEKKGGEKSSSEDCSYPL